MDCSCSCAYVCIDSYTETIQCKIKKARKEYECDECSRCILKGEEYEYYFGKDSKTYKFVHRTCKVCLSIRKELFCEGFIWGELGQDLLDYIDSVGGDIPSECLVKLIPEAKERVFDMIQDFWDGEDE